MCQPIRDGKEDIMRKRLFLIFIFFAIFIGKPPLFGDDDIEKELNQFFDHLPPTYSKGHSDMMQKIPEFGKYALPVLTMKLKDQDARKRIMAAEFLSLLGADAKEAVDDLLKALDDPNVDVQIRAAGALIDIDPESEEILKTVSQKMDDPHKMIRINAIHIVGEKNIPKLGEIVAGDSDADVRSAAAFVMGRLAGFPGFPGFEDKKREVVPMLRERLKSDESSNVRLMAALALSQFYAHGNVGDTETLDAALDRLLHDQDADVRRQLRGIFVFGRRESKKETFPYFEKLVDAALKGKPIERERASSEIIALSEIPGMTGRDLFQILSEKIDDPDPAIKAKVEEFLNRMGGDFKSLPLPVLVKKLNDSDASVQEEAAISLEKERAYLAEDEEKELRDLIKYELVRKKPPAVTPVCEALCRLYENPMKWFRSGEYLPPYFSPSYRSALKSLGALFLLKGAPYCGKKPSEIDMKDIHSFMASALYGEKKEEETPCPPSNPFQSLNDFLSPFLEWSRPEGSYGVYGKLFSLLFLQELLSNTPDGKNEDKKEGTEKKELEEKISKIKKSLEKDIEIADQLRPSEIHGSLFASHLLTTTELAAPTSKGIDFVRKIINPEDPLSLAYSLESEMERSSYRDPKGSVGSVIQAHLVLYKEEPDVPLHRENLKKALALYRDQFPFLMMQLKRKGAHVGPYDLAPYYLYTSIPYATAALNLLLRDARPEEKEELLSIKEELKEMLLGLIQEDGLFQPDPFLPGYHNPMGGLALLPLAEAECQPAPAAKITTQFKSARDKLPLGILSQD